MHGDDEPYGSVHRVELFDRFPCKVRLPDDVSVMNRAATEDDALAGLAGRSAGCCAPATAPSPRDAKVVDLLDDWVRRDAPRLDADNDGKFDDAGPAIMDSSGGRSPRP